MEFNSQPAEQEERPNMNDEWLRLSADIINRLSRIDTTLTSLQKVVEGNGKPGLVQRVDSLEAVNDIKTGSSATKTRVVGVVMAIILAMLSVSVSLTVAHGNKEDAQRQADLVYQQKQEGRISTLELNVAVLMAGIHGPAGAKGKPGVQGKPGVKGDKGGIKLFGK